MSYSWTPYSTIGTKEELHRRNREYNRVRAFNANPEKYNNDFDAYVAECEAKRLNSPTTAEEKRRQREYHRKMRWERNRDSYPDASFAAYCARLDASHLKSYEDIRAQHNQRTRERYYRNKEQNAAVAVESSVPAVKIRRAAKHSASLIEVPSKPKRILTPEQRKMKRQRDHEYYCRKVAFREGITQEEVHARIMLERKRALDRYRYICKTAEKEGISIEEVRARIKAKKHR